LTSTNPRAQLTEVGGRPALGVAAARHAAKLTQGPRERACRICNRRLSSTLVVVPLAVSGEVTGLP
jgi:hypothetical protein